MKIIHKIITIALAVVVNSAAYASDQITSKVVYTGIYGNGDVYVAIFQTINEPNCSTNRFDVSAQNPVAKQVLAVANAAMVTGKSIRIVTQGCFNGYPTLDASRGSWFYIIDNP
jgi:hypothetical protein